MRSSVWLVATALLIPQLAVHAQEKGPGIYKVEFKIRDGNDAAAKAGRHYTLLMEVDHKAVFKVGNRVPVATGSFQPGAGPATTQYTYLDVGVNIECMVSEAGNGRLAMHGSLDLSTMMQNDAGSRAASPPNPTVGQTKLDLETAIEPGKPTVVAAIDDPANLRQFQVEATITRVN